MYMKRIVMKMHRRTKIQNEILYELSQDKQEWFYVRNNGMNQKTIQALLKHGYIKGWWKCHQRNELPTLIQFNSWAPLNDLTKEAGI